jgi:hypothetical protein
VRHEKVLIDTDLAQLYGVETGALNRAVKRNASRFPADFMFQLSAQDWDDLRCQIGISSGHGCRHIDTLEARYFEQFSNVFDTIKKPIIDDKLRKNIPTAESQSLARREGLRGKVQCIYFDPPYGIKFNSNFQWSTP